MGASRDLTSMGNNQVHFDSDSYPVGIDNHASRCMVNSPHLFEDLKLSDSEGEVDGISEGLAIKGTGTFKFVLTDNDGKAHIIRIKNSLYLPGLKYCLLSPQHWAQEAGDNKTWMGNFARCCILHWGEDFMKTVPFNPSTNTPIFFTAPSSCVYPAFTNKYEGFEANFFQRETVLKLPGHRLPREDKEVNVDDVLLVDEFIAKENLHQKKKGSSIRRWANGRLQLTSGPFGSSTKLLEFEDVREDDKEVREDDEKIQTANSAPDATICRGPLTFDPSPPLAKDEDAPLAAADNQAELMRWHYRLGHLHFPKLKQLAINSKIPKKLAKVTPPKCAGCLFSTMTKLPWRGKEKKSSHLFVATKPGETVSVNQMSSTKVGFFFPAEGDTYQEALQVRNHLCGPLLLSAIHPSPNQ
jgi:hypothetical protein